MREPVTRMLYEYWNDVRGDRFAPQRFEIEPSCIASILPDTFILERFDGKTSRFRLAGTRICEAFVAEFRGVNLLELFEDEDRVTLERQLSVIARQGAVGLFTIGAETEPDRAVRFEMVILPLLHTRETVDRFIGSLVPLDRHAWLGTAPLMNTKLLTVEMIWPDGRPHAVVERAHHQAPFMPHIREARIVRSDRRQFRVYDGGLGKLDKD